MRLSGLLVIALLTLSAGCATFAPAPPNFYIMRHLQKAEGSDPPLTALGRSNAALLRHLVGDDPPRAIYVSTTRRARETAAQLAESLHLTPQEYDPRDTPGLLARLRAERGTVLVVGHSNSVPDIVEGVGGRRPDPIGDETYGWIYYIHGRERIRTLMRADVGSLQVDAADQ